MAKQQNVTKPWDQDLMDQIEKDVSADRAISAGPQPETPGQERRRVDQQLQDLTVRKAREAGYTVRSYQGKEIEPEPTMIEQPPREKRPERQSYLGRDLETGQLVGRETFMGQPLTPKLERIPASMRGRVEQSQAIAAQSGKMGLTGPPTPERVAAVREAIAERIASAKTEEDRKQVEQQQAKILDQIQTETINSAGMIVDMARRGDQLAAQFAPIIMEELGELREVEMQMARLDPSDETGMEEMREIRSEIIESIQSIVGTGAMPELIERTRNAPSEEDLAEQQQMQARVEQRMAQAQQRSVERQQQSQMSLATDLQRIDEQTQRSIDRIDQLTDLDSKTKIAELKRQAAQQKIQAQTAHYRQQRINEEFADFDQVNVLQNELMTQRNPRVLRPWLEAMYGGADVIEQMGGYEVVLENTRDEIREYIGEQSRRSRSTGFVHEQASALSIGDLEYLYAESDDVRIMVDKLGISNPEDMAMMLRNLQLQASTDENAQELADLVNSIPIPPVHDYDAVRQVYPPLRELMQ